MRMKELNNTKRIKEERVVGIVRRGERERERRVIKGERRKGKRCKEEESAKVGKISKRR